MIKVASTISETVVTPRGGDALEIKLKDRGLSSVEIRRLVNPLTSKMRENPVFNAATDDVS